MNFFKGMSLLPELLKSKVERKPRIPIPVIPVNIEQFKAPLQSDYRLTWFGHSAVLIETTDMKLFFDPMLGTNPSPLSRKNKRFSCTLPCEIENLPPLDAIILTHDHYDHLDYNTIVQLDQQTKQYIVPLGVGSHLQHWGISKNKITELDWWQTSTFGAIKFTCTPAQHFSGRRLRHRDTTLWCSFVIEFAGKRLFFSGDSGYSESFRKIGEHYGKFDLCMLECGQYHKYWKEIHMLPEETWQAFKDLNGETLLPIHWGAFSLSLHAWNEPPKRLIKASGEESMRILTPKIGQIFEPSNEKPTERWWKEEEM